MIDKKILDRLKMASKIYGEKNPESYLEIEEFIRWLYKQYGYVYEDRSDH